MATNNVTGIDAGFRTPGNFVEAIFAQGPSAAAGGPREFVFVMPKIAAGTWTAGTLYRVRNAQEAETGGGAGSPIHRGLRKFLALNKNAKVWALPVAPTTGGSPAAATAVLTIAETATAAGTLSVTVAGELCQYSYDSGETPTNIGDGIAAAINSKSWLPCTAANSSGTVTLTAKLQGVSQGTGSLGVIRVRAEISSGTTVTASFGGAFLGTGTAGADGTTTEAAQTATALANIASTRKYYIVTSQNTATGLGHFKTHVATKSLPKQGLRSVFIGGFTGSLAACTTIATGLNYERGAIAWQANSEHDSAELAAILAAVRGGGNVGFGGTVAGETTDTAQNFNLLSLNGAALPAFSQADWPDADDVEDAITDGITVIASNDNGAYLVQSVTTRSKNSAGSQDDFRASRTNKVSVTDDFLDTLLARLGANYGQKKLGTDELLANGQVNPNQRQIRNVIKPSTIKNDVKKLVDEFYDAGKVDEPDIIKQSVSTGSEVAGRVDISLDLRVIDWLDQTTTRLAEVSPG